MWYNVKNGGCEMDTENKIEKIEECKKINEEMWVSELIDLVKDQSKSWRRAFFTTIAILFGTIIIVFVYLWQYDFTSTIEQNGVYTLVDSQGNVISSDITPDQINDILEIINNGKYESNKETD